MVFAEGTLTLYLQICECLFSGENPAGAPPPPVDRKRRPVMGDWEGVMWDV